MWTCAFPGKMGLSWKRAWTEGTKEEAEAEASKWANVIALPVQLFEHIKQMEHRMVVAERKLMEETGIRIDYGDKVGYYQENKEPTFTNVRPKKEETK
jgi:hypothetical protein